MRFKLTPLFKAIVLGVSLDASAVFANPEGGEVVAGEAAINREDSRRLNISQSSNKAIINWQTFNIAADESVNITTPTASAITLNRVTGQSVSDIEGQLHSTGQVWLINPNGILFGKQASVNTSGLLASTLNITNDNFIKGDYQFTQDNNNSAKIINHGQLHADQGSVALLAPQIENTGVVSAHLGTVAMAAGTKATVTFEGNHLLNIEVPQGASVPMYDEDGNPVAALSNTGTIEANGGNVLMTAESVNTLLDQSINLSGIIKADTVEQAEGKIILLAKGNIIVDNATLSAQGLHDGEHGGDVKIIGQNVALTNHTEINASGTTGGGDIRVGKDARDINGNEADITYIDSTTSLNANATQSGNGGFIETSGKMLDIQTQQVSAKGALDGESGTWLLDPFNVTISNSSTSGGSFSGGTFTPTNNNSTVDVNSILTLLTNGTSVTITTGSAGIQAGDIILNSALNVGTGSAGTTLTFDAAGKIMINNTLSTLGNLTLNAGDDITQTASLTIAGNSTFNAGTNDIILNNSNNDFGHNAVTLTGNDVTLLDHNSTGLVLGNINASGNLNIATYYDGQSPALTQNTNTSIALTGTDKTASFNVGNGTGQVLLTSTDNNFNGNTLNVGQIDGNQVGNVSIIDNSDNTLNIGQINSAGDVTLTASGAINQVTDGQINDTGLITANSSGSSISLVGNGNNQFGRITASSGENSDISITSSNGIVIQNAINAGTGTVNLMATGNHGMSDYDTDAYIIAGTSNLIAGSTRDDTDAAISFANATNQLGTVNATAYGSGGITLTDGNTNGITLHNMSAQNTNAAINVTAVGPLLLTGDINAYDLVLSATGTTASQGYIQQTSGTITTTHSSAFEAYGTRVVSNPLYPDTYLGVDLLQNDDPTNQFTHLSMITHYEGASAQANAVGNTSISGSTNNGLFNAQINNGDATVSNTGIDSGTGNLQLSTNGTGGININGNLTSANTNLSTSGAITQQAGTTLSGVVSMSNATSATLNNTGDLELGAINVNTLNVTSSGNVTQNESITTSGGAVTMNINGDFNQSAEGSITAGSDSTWGDITLHAGTGNVSTGAITLGGIIQGNAINIESGANSTGDITQSGNIISNDTGTTGISIVNYGTGAIEQTSTGSMSLTFEDSPAPTTNLGIALTAFHGNITQSGSLNAEKSAATLSSGEGNITQNNGADILGSITAGSTYISGIDSVDLSGSNALGILSGSSLGDLTVNDSSNNSLMLGNVATEGNISITAHSLLQKTDTAITMNGTSKTATFIVNEGGSVMLNNTSNNFGANAVSVVGTNNKAAGTVEINDSNTTGLELGIIKSGALTATATGALMQQGDITATGNVNLTGAAISSYADLDAGSNSINLTTMDGNIISGNNAVLFNNGMVTTGDLNITTASGGITQDTGIVHSTGTMTINASDGKQDNGNSINLTNPNNFLGTVTITHASDVNLAGKNGYTISGITSTGNISAQTNYGLDPSVQATGTLSIRGNINTTKTDGSINLRNEITNATYGIEVTNTGSLSANSDITLGTSSSENGLTNNGINIAGNIQSNGGNISIFDNRSYGQTPDSSYAANMNIAGMIDATTGSIQIEDFGAGTITLENNGVVDSNEITIQGNALTLAGSLTGNNINLNSKSNLSLGNITAANNFMVSSFGAVTQTSNTILDITGTTTIGGQSNDVTLNNENHFHDAVSIIGNNISVTQGEANGDLSLGELNAFGDVMVSAKGGSLILNGSTPNITLRNDTSDKTVTLIANQLQNTNNNAIDLGTGANAWHIYLTHLNGNTFGDLSSGQQAIWGTSYPTSISQAGNRYIFATNEQLTLTPLSDLFSVTKFAGNEISLPSPTAGINYNVSGFVDASSYNNVFTQDTLSNINIGGLEFYSVGENMDAAVGEYPITLTNAAQVATGYQVTYNPNLSYGRLMVEQNPTPPIPPAPPTPNVEIPSDVNPAIVMNETNPSSSSTSKLEQQNFALQQLMQSDNCSMIAGNLMCSFTLSNTPDFNKWITQNPLDTLLSDEEKIDLKNEYQNAIKISSSITINTIINPDTGRIISTHIQPMKNK